MHHHVHQSRVHNAPFCERQRPLQNRTITISLLSFQGDDVTGLSLSLWWGNNVHTMQSLRAKRLEEGALLELLQAEGGARGGRRCLATKCRESVHELKNRSSTIAGNGSCISRVYPFYINYNDLCTQFILYYINYMCDWFLYGDGCWSLQIIDMYHICLRMLFHISGNMALTILILILSSKDVRSLLY